VWTLFTRAIDVLGPKPTLIEWDTQLPDFAFLQEQALQAAAILSSASRTDPADALAV
jgi:uncharacterized protein (UPF0276 family)